MGRARRARRIAQTAAYGGGVGVAGLGAIGALSYGVLRVEAAMTRRIVGRRFEAPPVDAGRYGAGPGEPIRLIVLGDSTAAGLGVDHPHETIGATIANGVAAFSGRPVEVTNVAVVGALSPGLEDQLERALADTPAPDVALLLIGANDVTHRLDRSVAVRHLEMTVRRLRETGAEVVVGTCPDLGAVEPAAPAVALARAPLVARPCRSPDGRRRRGRRPRRLGRRHARCRLLGRPQDDVQRGPLPPERCRLRPSRRSPPAVGERRPRPLRRAHHPDPSQPAAWRRHRAGRQGGHPRRRPPRHRGRSRRDRRSGPRPARPLGGAPAPHPPGGARLDGRPSAGLARRRARRLRSRGRQRHGWRGHRRAYAVSPRTPPPAEPRHGDERSRRADVAERADASADSRRVRASG